MIKSEAERRANKKYAVANKEKLKERNLAYRKNNPELCLLRAAKNRALKRGIAFDLLVEDIVIPEYCPILKIKLVRNFGTFGGQDASPSLDRIDNSKGYVKGNVWVISRQANSMKYNANQRELKLFADWINNTYA